MGITEVIITSITSFISFGGYTSVFLLMIFESMVVPIPSEAVLPFAGFLISAEKFTFAGLVLAGTLGSIVGSFFSYWIGEYGGNAFIKKFGKYVFLHEKHLLQTEHFFAKRGNITVFIGRFIPVVRHLISIPAGIARMNKLKFLLYTVLGAGLWNAFLVWVGFVLKENWEVLGKYTKVGDVIVVCTIFIFVIWILLKTKKRKNHSS